ncbi:MAG: hypothetical protein A3E23_23270 [Burkholderiales bacterium RIFCSPHIGHO2_12_FULL_65_48]|nr:MAG: hypothetical protein A3E23_23270 [Burkholderiales bacterium RIFCSPHIGHO2_12_FULL_65_48]
MSLHRAIFTIERRLGQREVKRNNQRNIRCFSIDQLGNKANRVHGFQRGCVMRRAATAAYHYRAAHSSGSVHMHPQDDRSSYLSLSTHLGDGKTYGSQNPHFLDRDRYRRPVALSLGGKA